MKVACVFRESHEFKVHHVYALADSILEFNNVEIVCLTDADINHSAVEKIPLKHHWPKWWSKIELFNLCRGPTLYLDIDTVVIDKLPPITMNFTMLKDVYKPGGFGSGVMSWQQSPLHVYKKFKANPQLYMNNYATRDKWGDQDFIVDNLGFEPDVFGGEYKSYKAQCRAIIPDGTKVVYFHGKPRPWEVELKRYSR